MKKQNIIILIVILLLFLYWRKTRKTETALGGGGLFSTLQEMWNWNNRRNSIDPETGEIIKDTETPIDNMKWDLSDPLKPDDTGTTGSDPVKPDDPGTGSTGIEINDSKPEGGDPIKSADPVKPPSGGSSSADSKFSGDTFNWKGR